MRRCLNRWKAKRQKYSEMGGEGRSSINKERKVIDTDGETNNNLKVINEQERNKSRMKENA